MRFWSALLLRCPRCRSGKAFRSLWQMHETCPQCGLPFSRGPGYFFGAMYFSYGIGILSALPTSIVLVVKQVEPIWVGLIVTAQLTVLSPILFRYSRVVWMYFDQWLDPR